MEELDREPFATIGETLSPSSRREQGLPAGEREFRRHLAEIERQQTPWTEAFAEGAERIRLLMDRIRATEASAAIWRRC